jgi:hypothetical protein
MSSPRSNGGAPSPRHLILQASCSSCNRACFRHLARLFWNQTWENNTVTSFLLRPAPYPYASDLSPTFRRNISPSSSGPKSKRSAMPGGRKSKMNPEGKGKVIPVQAVETLRVAWGWGSHIFRHSVHRLRQGCQPYGPETCYSQEASWYSFLLEAESTPGP